MNKNRVLVVDDEAAVRNFMTKAITNCGYEVTVATNGAEALEFFIKNPFPVIVTDLSMPIMPGEVFIDNINSLEKISPPTIIVLTSQDDIKKVIEIMKKGVFDYQIKPANSSDLSIKLKNAFKVYELNKIQYSLEKEKELRLNEQLAWIKYKEELKDKDSDKSKNDLIHNLKHNLGQAGGFGTLLTLIDLIYVSAKQDGENFIISKDIMNLIKDNAEMLQKTLEIMEKITYISENPANLVKTSLLDFHNMIEEVIDINKQFISINNNSILLSEIKPIYSSSFISINQEQMKQVLEEGIKNACKFSEQDSKIFFFLRINNGYLAISILNEPTFKIGIKGIPLEYSNLVFEPFYRISKFVDERYKTLDLGIGLSLVKAIIKKHNGTVTISNIKDFTANNLENIKVNLEIEIPISE